MTEGADEVISSCTQLLPRWPSEGGLREIYEINKAIKAQMPMSILRLSRDGGTKDAQMIEEASLLAMEAERFHQDIYGNLPGYPRQR